MSENTSANETASGTASVPQTDSEGQSVGVGVATGARKARKVVRPALATAEPAKVDRPMIGTGASNVPPALAKAAEAVTKLEAKVESQKAEILRLQEVAKAAQKRNQQADRLPVTDKQLDAACAALLDATKADPSTPRRSLASQFLRINGVAVFVGDATEEQRKDKEIEHVTPEMTAGQRKVWKLNRGKIDLLHSNWTKHEAPKIIQTVKRTLPKPGSLAAGRLIYRKIGVGNRKVEKVVGASIKAVEAKAPKPDAKPDLGPARSGA